MVSDCIDLSVMIVTGATVVDGRLTDPCTSEFPCSSDLQLRKGLRLAAMLCVLAAAALALDLRVSRARPKIASGSLPFYAWTLAEFFGDGKGVLVIAAGLGLLTKSGRFYLLRLLACAYGAGLAANVGKLILARVRPRALEVVPGVLASFQGFAILRGEEGALWNSTLQSFPSAHTATAVGFAVGLGWLFPRGRIIFALLAVLVAVQRVAVGAHFLSDTLVGAAVGCVVAALCLDRRWFGKRFDVWEQRLRE